MVNLLRIRNSTLGGSGFTTEFFAFLVILLALLPLSAFAKLQDIEAAQAKSRASYIERFSEFTQDKNVMGRPRSPDGKIIKGRVKQSFNPDDHVTFQSDLTYHDYNYETGDEAHNSKVKANSGKNNDDSSQKERQLMANISPHGASSAGSGSSLLERTVYQLFDKYAKEEDKKSHDEKQKQEGVRQEGPFTIETQKVEKKSDSSSKGDSDKSDKSDDQPDKVERVKFNPEVEKKISEVGKSTFRTVERAAKDPDKKDDAKSMGNIERYYWAANQALEALWNSTLANLGQRRANVGVPGGNEQVQLSEDTPTCAAWEQKMLSNIKQDDPDKDSKTQEGKRMRQQCEQIISTNYHQIYPKIESDENGKMAMKEKGPAFEDGRQRDSRLQLELMNKVGARIGDFQSNWKYNDKDEKALVTVSYDKEGNPSKETALRMDEQVDRYNEQLKSAASKLSDIKSRFPDLQTDAKTVEGYQIPKNKLSAKDITKFPTNSRDSDFEMGPVKQKDTKLPDSYDALVKQN